MTWRFDDVLIDAESFRVTRAGESIRLEPKALELLLFLVANAGRLVTKAEIQQAVWKDTAVTENALTRLVAQIRKGLGDDAREARYIETVPTRGYRFVAELEAAPRPAVEARAEGPAEEATRAQAPLPPEPPAARTPAAPRHRLAGRTMVVAASLLGVLLVGLVARWMARPRIVVTPPLAAAPRPLETQVSTGAELNINPRFSPDGSSLAYATLRKGSLEVVQRALAPGAKELSVTSDGQQNVQPAFSPDGRLIAYHSLGRGGIWVVPALGGLPRQLTTFGSSPAWSPDGLQLAFQGQSWVGAGETFSAASEGSTLWLVPSAGGEPRQLTWIEAVGPGGQGGPAWSPDGALIAFLAGTRVFTVRADGSGVRATSGRLRVHGVAWGKSGRSQVWTGSEPPEHAANWRAWRVPVSPETGEQTGALEVLASGGERASAWCQPALTPDGRSIAFVTFRTRYELLAQRVTPKGVATGAPSPLVTGVAGRKVPLGFSPDGRRFAFTTSRPGAGLSVWVADVATGDARLVAEGRGLQLSRAWFPDGRRIGYVAAGAQGASFWSVDVDTGEAREHRPMPGRLTWAPLLSRDGRALVSHGALNGRLNVWRMDLSGGAARPLTNDPEGVGWPVWSPDGGQIAVEMMRGGDTRIGLMPAEGGPLREVVRTPGQNWPHSFSPDGRRIAFAGQRRGIWNVYSAPVSGAAEQAITSYASPALYVRYPDWSPLADRVIYEYAESTSTVWLANLQPVGE